MANFSAIFAAVLALVSLALALSDVITAAGQANNSAAFLTAHNVERQKTANMTALVWNATLTAYATAYAASQDKSGAGCSGSLKHSGGPYGENLYWYWTSTGALATPAQAVNAWIAEKQYYTYKNNSCAAGKVCGHYTQVVWAKTRRVGCFVRACTSNRGATYVICSYDPPGNYVGQRPY